MSVIARPHPALSSEARVKCLPLKVGLRCGFRRLVSYVQGRRARRSFRAGKVPYP
jgi:hypothetical protein